MKESATFQEILREGVEQGQAAGVRSILLRRGPKKFGPPDATVQARLEAVVDVRRLEDLTDQMLDGPAKTWDELLGPIA